MASYDKNIQLGVVDANGDIYVLYPQSKATNITVDVGSSGYLYDNNLTDVQAALVKMGADIAAGGGVPTDHASTATTYGGGTASNYGHVKVSDNYTSSAGAAAASVAASSKAVYDTYAYALNRITYGTTDYTAGSTALTTGNVYLYYT